MTLDGTLLPTLELLLVDDRQPHQARLQLIRSSAPPALAAAPTAEVGSTS